MRLVNLLFLDLVLPPFLVSKVAILTTKFLA